MQLDVIRGRCMELEAENNILQVSQVTMDSQRQKNCCHLQLLFVAIGCMLAADCLSRYRSCLLLEAAAPLAPGPGL